MTDRVGTLDQIRKHFGPGQVRFEGEGEDHTAWRVDAATGTWIVRVPKRPDSLAAASAEREVALMNHVRAAIGSWVPEAFQLDASTAMTAYPLVPGVALQDRLAAGAVSAHHLEDLGAQLGRFVRDIAALDPSCVQGIPVDGTDLRAWRDETVPFFASVSALLEPGAVGRIESFLAAEPPGKPEADGFVFIHNDLGAEHVLVDDDLAIVGIIDWADSGIGDPATDFGRVLRDLGPVAFRRALDHYRDSAHPERTALADRSVFYARCLAIENLAFALRHRPDLVQLERQNLERLFGSAEV